MKFLVSSLFLVFLSGTYGAAIEQQDVTPSPSPPPPPRHDMREAVRSLTYHTIVYGADMVANWESSEEDREAAVNRRENMMWKSYLDFGYGIFECLTDISTEVNNEIKEKYPVFYNDVVPVFASFFVKSAEQIGSAIQEIMPHFTKFEEGCRKRQNEFWEDIRPIIQNRTRPTIDALNANLKPFIDGVRKEVTAANVKEDSTFSPEQDTAVALAKEKVMFTDRLKKLFTLEHDQMKKVLSDLDIYNSKG